MVTGRKNRWISVFQTGVLLAVAGSLLFLYKIPWMWMQESAPLLAFGGQTQIGGEGLLVKTYTVHLPLYDYVGCGDTSRVAVQNVLSVEEIMLAEARDEEKHMLSKENKEEIKQAMEQENSAFREEVRIEKEDAEEKTEAISTGVQTVAGEKVQSLDMEKYSSFDEVLKDFYVVDRSTYITAEELRFQDMLKQDLRLEDAAEGPQVLIYHTHSQEGYADSVPGDESGTVVGAGAKLAELLEGYGIRVLHHKGQYDVENRDYAYANAEAGLKKILEENPSIEVIIDLHRDGVADDTHLVTEVNGKPTAQFMFFNGLSRLKSTGEIDYLKNENREGNLAFSLQLQVKCMEYYPNLARSIYLKGYRYNMQYREKSLLVELGAQTNTVEEVYNALPPLAHVISMVLLGE